MSTTISMNCGTSNPNELAPIPEFQALVDQQLIDHAPLTTYLLTDRSMVANLDINATLATYDQVTGQDSHRPSTPTERIVFTPLPFVHVDFLQPTEARSVCQSLALALERLVLGIGEPFGYAGGYVYGLLNAPRVIRKRSLQAAADALTARRYYGPFTAVRREACFGALPEISAPLLPDGTEIVFEHSPASFRLLVALTPRVIRWNRGFKAIACVVPQSRQDAEGNVAIAVSERGAP